MSTIELHMASLWRHKVSAPSLIWMYWKYTWKLGKNNFSLKNRRNMGFRRIFGWICKKMMILIYIASSKHISCQIFKVMDKIRIMGFHQPPSTILFDDPHTQTTTPNHLIYIKRCVKNVEMISLKRLAQFIGQKKAVLKKNIWGIFCYTSSEGMLLQSPPRIFYTERLIPLYLLPVYRYGPPLSIDTIMSTIKFHMTSPWRHKVSTPSEILMHWKYTWN